MRTFRRCTGVCIWKTAISSCLLYIFCSSLWLTILTFLWSAAEQVDKAKGEWGHLERLGFLVCRALGLCCCGSIADVLQCCYQAHRHFSWTKALGQRSVSPAPKKQVNMWSRVGAHVISRSCQMFLCYPTVWSLHLFSFVFRMVHHDAFSEASNLAKTHDVH